MVVAVAVKIKSVESWCQHDVTSSNVGPGLPNFLFPQMMGLNLVRGVRSGIADNKYTTCRRELGVLVCSGVVSRSCRKGSRVYVDSKGVYTGGLLVTR